MGDKYENLLEASYRDALERTQTALTEIQALYHVSHSLSGFEDLPRLLQTVVDSVVKVLSADRVTLITFDLEAHDIIHYVKGGAGIEFIVPVLFDELWSGLSGWVLREKQPALSPKTDPDPRESIEVQRRRSETNCGAIIVVPVRYQDKLLGTITAINRPEQREFTERDVELMVAMADQSAVAIEHARLYAELQSTNAELERRVHERTAELADMNTHLQLEIARHDRAFRALQTSEERYRMLVETMNDGLVVVDESLLMTYVNRRFGDLLGYTSDELIGQPSSSLLDEANRAILDQQIAKRRAGEYSLYELDWTTRQGNRISTLVSATPLLDDQGEFRGGFAIVTDINEHKRMQDKLAAERTLLRTVIDTIPDYIFVKDIESRFIEGNVATALGVKNATRDDYIGKTDYDFHAYDKAAGFYAQEQSLMQTGQPLLNEEQLIILPDGKELWVWTSKVPWRNTEGKIMGLVGISRDITELRHTQEALRQSEKRFSTIFHTSPISISLWSISEKRYIDVNNTHLAMFGYSREELLGGEIKAISLWGDLQQYAAYQRLSQAQSEVHQFEFVFRRKSGETGVGLLSTERIEVDGADYLVSFTLDITERKRAEEHAREFQEKLKALQEISLELESFESIEPLCRRAIELGHSRLGYDRMGLLLFDNAEKSRVSRFGIESTGELRVERGVPYKVEEDRVYPLLTSRETIFVGDDADLGDFESVVGRGWNVVVGIWDANGSIGWLAADNYFDNKPLIPYQVELLKLYGLTLGHLVTRKRTEAALQASEKQYRLLAENSMDMISLHAPDGVYLYVSPSCRTLLGYEPDDLIGHSAYEFFHPEDFAAVRQSHNAVLDQPVTYTVQYRIRRKDNQFIWFETVSRTLRDRQTGAAIEIQAGSRDITERKQADEALRRYNQRLAILHEIDRGILVAHSPVAIAEVLLDQMVQLIPCDFASVVLYNEDVTKEWVIALEQIPDFHIQVGNVQPVVPNEIMALLKAGQSVVGTREVTDNLIAEEGPYALMIEELISHGIHSAMTNPMIAQGRLVGALILASKRVAFFTPEYQQIGEELAAQVAIALHQAELDDQIAKHNVQLEARVRERTAQLEAANRELELFSYSVSHDLRAPLRAVQGFAEIIARRHRSSLNDEGARYFDNIVTASEQMNQLITDLLAYARLGRQRIQLQPISLDAVLAEVMDSLAPEIEETGAQIDIADPLPDVLGDKTLLKQIFTNLLQNALAYHRPGVPPIIDVSSVLEADSTLVHVTDNGIGIPAEFQEKIFNIFQRLHTQDQYPGTGIGLAIVRKSAEMLNGTVWVESVGEVGSRFCIRFPYRAEKDD